jgi:hypothetical protein
MSAMARRCDGGIEGKRHVDPTYESSARSVSC